MRSIRSSMYPNSNRGFTLMELLVSTALTLVLLAGVWTMLDIFSSMEQRGQRQTARARLTRGLYKQLQDDISQATLGGPPPDAKRILVSQLAPPPQPVEENTEEVVEEAAEGENEEDPIDDSIGGLLSEEDEEDPNVTADAGSLDKKPKRRDSPFAPLDSSGDPDSTDSGMNDAPNPFGTELATTALPPEYAMVVGGPTWMILDLPIPTGDNIETGGLLSSSGANSNSQTGRNWTAPRTFHRVIYHYVAPEDLLVNDKLTLGLTRWAIDWQAAPITTLIEELRKDEFSAPKSIIWRQPKNSGAGSALSFVAANRPPVDREEIPEIKRILFRYYSKKSAWSSQWNSVARRELPDAIQMRVLWHDPRTEPADNTDDENGDSPADDSRFSSRDGSEEAELLAEWDEDLDRGYGESSLATSSSGSTKPPEGYAEYMFIIPAANRPVKPERIR